jgi:hypothetical protein
LAENLQQSRKGSEEPANSLANYQAVSATLSLRMSADFFV